MKKTKSERENYFDKTIASGEQEFSKHVAVVTGDAPGEGLTCIRWAKPDSSCYWMDIIIHAGAVFIRGDLGEATYVWNSRSVSPGFLLGCNFGYFFGKCEASEKGSRPKDWLESAAIEWLTDWREGALRDDDDFDPAKFDALADRMRRVAHDGNEWSGFIDQHYHDEIQDVFGVDAWECGVWDAGKVPMVRCILHWLGIRLALLSLGYGSTAQEAA